jgi:hypothetical protein
MAKKKKLRKPTMNNSKKRKLKKENPELTYMDIIKMVRKTWGICPVTKVKPSKKLYKRKMKHKKSSLLSD